ncbi:MAG: PAS domain-containing protein [Desulfobulbaceae bacterium]|nr:PAS domain-containing protein [Desulfobulbaceae bacterium]
MQEIAHIGNWDWNVEDDTFYYSEELCRIMGQNIQPLDNLNSIIKRLVHEKDEKRVCEVIGKALEENTSYMIDYRIRRNSEEVYLSQLVEVLVNEEGDPTKLQGMIRDVTESELVKMELNDLSERLSLVTKSAHI